MKQKPRKKSFLLILLSFLIPFIIFLALFFLLSARASADKFQSSFSNDYMTQTKQQDLKIPTVKAQKVQTTITLPVQQQTVQTQVQAQPIAPSLDIPPSPDISSPSISMPVSSLAASTAPALTQTRISVPDYEERYLKSLAAQAEAKKKKKKSLIDSIFEEIMHYGFFIVFGLVIFVVVLALRKDKETPGTGFQMPQHPEKPLGEEQEEPKKDIWQDF